MKFTMGIALLLLAAFAVWMMSVTKTIPFSWGQRRAKNPAAFRGYLAFYGVLAGVGALLLLAHYTGL